MAAKVYEATLSRDFRAGRPMVWALVADTNRWDRCSGLTPGTYRWEEVDGRRMRAAVEPDDAIDAERAVEPDRLGDAAHAIVLRVHDERVGPPELIGGRMGRALMLGHAEP